MALSCIAAEVSTNQTARIRDVLKNIAGQRHPFPSPYGSNYGTLRHISETENIPMPVIDAELVAVLEENSVLLKKDVPVWEQGWPLRMCEYALGLMGLSGKQEFLPHIEKMALESFEGRLRVVAVRAHIAICGFDSFPFVKRAVAALPDNIDGHSVRFRMLKSLGEYDGHEGESASRIEEISAYFMKQQEIDPYPLVCTVADTFLVKRVPEYASSRQRYRLADRFQNDTDGNIKAYFIPVKTELDKIPEAKRTDMR
jgi:hypothetical protein